MGTNAAATVDEIEEIRGRLDEEVRALERRIPPAVGIARRAAGVALGSGVLGTVATFALKRARRRTKPPRTAVVVQVLPDDAARRLVDAVGRGRWQLWTGGLAAAWVVVRLAEARAIRRAPAVP